MEKKIEEIFNIVKKLKGGKVADYIPQLACVNPELFGISICTVDGKRYNFGDHDVRFCLQSCSKPLSYCLAYEELGEETVHKNVGYEPSGREFNAFILNKQGLPHNPMINAGAIMVSSLIGRGLEPAKRFEKIKNFYTRLAGNTESIGFENTVFLSEQHHADRNISLAYYMRENNAFHGEKLSPNEITESLNLYFQQCSTTVNTKMGAIIAATLANAGVCPVNNDTVMSKGAVKACLTLMYGCGMYDYSGQFSFEVGLPAKSGVSGCILLVIPNKMGVCIWSPSLDEQGNSYRGIEFCKRLSKEMKLHIFHNIVSNIIDLDRSDNLINRFIYACSNGKVELVKELLDKVDINCCDYDKRTPLHLAVSEGNLEIVKILLNNKVEINVKDRWGNTPLSEINGKEGKNYEEIKKLFIKNS